MTEGGLSISHTTIMRWAHQSGEEIKNRTSLGLVIEAEIDAKEVLVIA